MGFINIISHKLPYNITFYYYNGTPYMKISQTFLYDKRNILYDIYSIKCRIDNLYDFCFQCK